MNELNQQTVTETCTAEVAPEAARPAASVSRRRLIKLGTAAVPVVATLASRPALAWHCQSPSAWGSEIINPNTSLKNNLSHKTYIDETWTIVNWKTNMPRTEVDLANGQDAGRPWIELRLAYPALNNIPACNPLNSNNNPVFNFKLVTIDHLVQCGFTNPGISSGTLIKNLPSGPPSQTTYATYALIGQLNYAVLKRARFKNDIDMCLADGQLSSMASGNYKENGQYWDAEKVASYLYNNWIVR